MGENPIPENYPQDIEGCLKVFEDIRYRALGFPIVWLYYNYFDKKWSMAFRNPENFENPEIVEDTPLKACHAMFDFLKTLTPKKAE